MPDGWSALTCSESSPGVHFLVHLLLGKLALRSGNALLASSAGIRWRHHPAGKWSSKQCDH
jgi:hypothetical protein